MGILDVNPELHDMRYLSWSERTITSGTSGMFLKSSEGAGTGKLYYKLSCYDSWRGIFGHECINEIVASRLMNLLGIDHVPYHLTRALVTVDGEDFETWVLSSGSYRHSFEKKQSLDIFFRLHRQGKEDPLALCDRMGWGLTIRRMMLVDYLIANRDRHGANIEVLLADDGVIRLAPLFDNGLSFVFSCYGDEPKVAQFDVMQDMAVNNFVGMRSLEGNLSFLAGWDLRVAPLDPTWKDELFCGLDQALSQTHINAMWNMIQQRWEHACAILKS